MPPNGLVLDYGNALNDAVGDAHGITSGELARSADAIRQIVERVERERGAGQHRYRDLPNDRKMLAAVRGAVRRHGRGIQNLVVLGIGGSALGNIALQTALNPPLYNLLPRSKRGGPRLFVTDNVDPVQFGDVLDLVTPELGQTLFNVISKSGETAETAAQFLIVRDLLIRKFGLQRHAQRILVTTDPVGGAMRQVVETGGYEALPVPPGVGGRFSVLSPVGLFSAGMCGVNISRILAGAAAMSKRVADPRLTANPAGVLAALLYAFYVRGKRLHVMFPYSYQLKDLADWYRQLWAESLGKQRDVRGNPVVVGPTPIRALGATDQHSQVQLYREGPNDKVFIFLEVGRFERDVKIARPVRVSAGGRRSGASGDGRLPETLTYLGGTTLAKLLNAEKRATEMALVASQRPCITIRFPKIDETTIGEFIMLWEAATTIMGSLLEIDPYDQPAVQLGKTFTFALMGRKGYDREREEYDRFAGAAGKHTV